MPSPEDTVGRLNAALAGRYTIERQVGRGGMASVYLAQDLKNTRKVAIKVLSPEVASSLGADRFLQEIEVAARLTHPNILPLLASGEADGLLYYVMPFVEEESLRERLAREKQLPSKEALRIVSEVAEALDHAHEGGVVHRDIKPENILLVGGHAVVADFGIAKALDAAGGTRLTQTGVAVGTPTYMSPEQAGGSGALDRRSDIYSLGCLAYELLGGEPPFTGPTPQAVLARHAVDPVPELRTIRPDVPRGVSKAIERALAKVPAARFPSAPAFAKALEDASTEEAIAAEVARRARATSRRRLWAAGAVAVLVAVGFWIVTESRGPAYERLAVLFPTNLQNDPEQESLILGVHGALISELRQSGISVIARNSVMQYRGSDTPARTIAAELGADALIEPTIWWQADSVEIEVLLVDGESEEYIGDPIVRREAVSNVFGLYRNMVRQVGEELQLALSPEAQARLATSEPVNSAAYQAYLTGDFHWKTLTEVGLETGLRYFEQALEREPDFAQAHAGIAWIWIARQQMGLAPPSEAGPRAREAVNRAMAIDSTLFEVQYVLAALEVWTNWDWEAGERAFRRAIALNSEHAVVRAYYAHLLDILGRDDEAQEQMDRAMDLDPLDALVLALYGQMLACGGQADEAIAFFEEALRTGSDNLVVRDGLEIAYHRKRMYRESLVHSAAKLATFGQEELATALDSIYVQEGYEAASLVAAETMADLPSAPPIYVSQMYDWAGEVDQAIAWIERAIEFRDPTIPYLTVNPYTETTRSDPRFKEFLRLLNLPDPE